VVTGGAGRWSLYSCEENGANGTQATRGEQVVQGEGARGVTWLQE
jgi:hypothetical protein